MKINRTVSWYRSNLTGSSLYAVDAGCTVVAHAVYDPWGAPLSSTYTDANFSGLESMLSYSSYSWDVTLELYYAQARMYTAADKRFTTQDPIRDDNMYLYCKNNPLVYTDIYGLWTGQETAYYAALEEQMFGNEKEFAQKVLS
jgi:RHS repeat-associated protein